MDEGTGVCAADDIVLVLSGFLAKVTKPLRAEAADAMEDIDACDAVDSESRKADIALDCRLRLLDTDNAVALEPIDVAAVNLVSGHPVFMNVGND